MPTETQVETERDKGAEYIVKFPVMFPTVDAGIVDVDEHDRIVTVILGQKQKEVGTDKWRFPGGFTDTTDPSFEFAAMREAGEETKVKLKPGHPKYIGSAKIDDPRYRESPHKIMTSLYLMKYESGEVGDGKGSDDLVNTRWFSLEELESGNFNNPVHDPLFEIVVEYIKYHNSIIDEGLRLGNDLGQSFINIVKF